MSKLSFGLLIFAVVAGLVGAIASIVMVISAACFQEWGRVLLYSVTTFACAEMTILAAMKLRNPEKS